MARCQRRQPERAGGIFLLLQAVIGRRFDRIDAGEGTHLWLLDILRLRDDVANALHNAAIPTAILSILRPTLRAIL
jgi:hypothetical protein